MPQKRWTPEEVKALRARLGWTQQEMAAHLGVAVSTVGRWEIGKAVPRGLYAKTLENLEQRGKDERT